MDRVGRRFAVVPVAHQPVAPAIRCAPRAPGLAERREAGLPAPIEAPLVHTSARRGRGARLAATGAALIHGHGRSRAGDRRALGGTRAERRPRPFPAQRAPGSARPTPQQSARQLPASAPRAGPDPPREWRSGRPGRGPPWPRERRSVRRRCWAAGGDQLPAYVSNGVIGLRVPAVPLRPGLAMLNGLAALHPVLGIEYSPEAPYPLAGDLTVGGVRLSDWPHGVGSSSSATTSPAVSCTASSGPNSMGPCSMSRC